MTRRAQIISAACFCAVLFIALWRTQSSSVAAIVSTHDPKMSAAADRVVELHDGVLGVRPHGRHLA